ncbi:MAG TPA: hypothetical protein VG937_28880 [Polyangiaceae bacterium]|nr:hypothetical protein [Polyangiaceae bacterium]
MTLGRMVDRFARGLGLLLLAGCGSVDSFVGAIGSGGTGSGGDGGVIMAGRGDPGGTGALGGASTGGASTGGAGRPGNVGGTTGTDGGAGAAGAGTSSGGGGSTGGSGTVTETEPPHWLAFSNEQGVFVYDLRTFPDPGSTVQLAGAQEFGGAVQWSPDGRTLLYRTTLDLFAVDMAGDRPGVPRLLVSQLPIFAMEWSADSRSVAIATNDELAVFDPTRARPTLNAVAMGDGCSFQWAPVGNKLLYSRAGEAQRVVSVESGVPSAPIAVLLESGIWSPDARTLAGNLGGKATLVRLDGNAARSETLASGDAPWLSFSPNGQRLVLQLQNQEQLPARYFDLTQPKAVALPVGSNLDLWETEVAGIASVSPWSPDSQSLALLVQGFEARFFAESVAGGSPVPMTGRLSQLSWSPKTDEAVLYGLRDLVEGGNDLVRLDTSQADAKLQWLYASEGLDLLVDYAVDPSGARAIARSPTISHLVDVHHPTAISLEYPIKAYRRFSSDHELAAAVWSPDGRFIAMGDAQARPHLIRFDGVNPIDALSWQGEGEALSYAFQPGKVKLEPVTAAPPPDSNKVNCDGKYAGNVGMQRDLSSYQLDRKLSDITTISELKDFCNDLWGGNVTNPDITVADCLFDLAYQGVRCQAKLRDYVSYVRQHDCSGLEPVCPGILAANDPPRDDEVPREGPPGLSIKGELAEQSFSLISGREGYLNSYGADGLFQTDGYWDASSYMLWGSIVTKQYKAILRLGPPDVTTTRLVCVDEAHAAFEKEATYPTIARKLGLFDGSGLSELTCNASAGSPVDLEYSDEAGGGGTLHGAPVTTLGMLPLRCAGELCYLELALNGAVAAPGKTSTLVLSVDAIAKPVIREDGALSEIEQPFSASHLIETDGDGQVSCGLGGTVVQRTTRSLDELGQEQSSVEIAVHVDSLSLPSSCPGKPIAGSLKGASN